MLEDFRANALKGHSFKTSFQVRDYEFFQELPTSIRTLLYGCPLLSSPSPG